MFWRSAFYWQVFLLACFSAHLDSVPFVFFVWESSRTNISSRAFLDCPWHFFKCPSEFTVLVELVGFTEIKTDVENTMLYSSVFLWCGKVLWDLHEAPSREKQGKINSNQEWEMGVLALLYRIIELCCAQQVAAVLHIVWLWFAMVFQAAS